MIWGRMQKHLLSYGIDASRIQAYCIGRESIAERKGLLAAHEKGLMDNAPRTSVTSRVIRKGSPLPDEQDWEGSTTAERINTVWALTLICLAWNTNQPGEPRLQRSLSRIQRSRR